ncbi:hypothetical protein BKA64DRAFT_775092 [Cadophora sp. MPI-SDFR-AT-0126]|nr:hypothetical protein BKA64DRAFT_775092 [Leotiomycetes sp. MPI-SDFR-AT-0126]
MASVNCPKLSPAQTISPLLLIQDSLKVFCVETINKILSLRISTSEHCSEETSRLWTDSTTTLPRIFRAAECWDEESRPSVTKLAISTLDHIDSTKKSKCRPYEVYRRSEQCPEVDPRLAIAQLIEPTEASPVIIIGLDILPQGIFHVPVSLSEFVEGVEEASQQLILTPKFAFTDLHLDTSDGISSPLGQCSKLWLVFPPTIKNLGLMKKADGQRAKIDRIGKELEGGLVLTTTSEEAIYLPAGCIHAVITLEGGFLIATDFTTPLSSRPHAAMINCGLDDSGAASTFQRQVFRRFLSSVDYGLSFRQENSALSSWIGTLEKIRSYAKEYPDWKKAANKVWDDFLMKKEAKETVCPCGKQGKAKFVDHFKRVHMWQVGKCQKRKLDEIEEASVQGKRPIRQSKRLKRK